MTETIFGKNLFDVYFDCLVLAHVLAANMEGAGLILQLATRGRSRCFGLLLGSCHDVHICTQSMDLLGGDYVNSFGKGLNVMM